MLNHARRAGRTPIAAPRDVHVADAAEKGDGAIGPTNQSGQGVTVLCDLALGMQVLDGGAAHIPEGGGVAR